MILTISLNPAVDKNALCDRLIPGQVNRLSEVDIYPGGKGINVSRALAAIGEEVCAMGFIGGESGDYIRKSVEKAGIRAAFTVTDKNTRTNLNIVSADGYVTEILEPGYAPDDAVIEEFVNSYAAELKKASLVVISGSLPEGMDTSFYRKLMTMAAAEDKRVIFDSSGDAMREGIEPHPFMIKPNLREFEYILGKRYREMDEIAEAAAMLTLRGIERVVVSLGAKGMIYADGDNRLFAAAPRLDPVNTVSCGDAAVAALAAETVRSSDPATMLRRAVAVSAAAALCQESGTFRPEDAKRFFEKTEINRLQ